MGRVAARSEHTGAYNHGGGRLMRQPSLFGGTRGLIVLLMMVCLASMALPQSGRRKDEQKKKPSGVDTTSAAATDKTTQTGSQTDGTSARSGQKQSDEVDSSDTLHISSTLVPVPASVVDARGFVISNLKLEDFELQVDGQIKRISDLSRSQTPVQLAMLFDNSGSLMESRDLEKHAARRFFSRVLRPMDQAAIYSVATENYLAQPLTNDVRRLEQTIENFGKPEGGTALL